MVGKIDGIYSWMSAAQIKSVSQVLIHFACLLNLFNLSSESISFFGPMRIKLQESRAFDGPASSSPISTLC